MRGRRPGGVLGRPSGAVRGRDAGAVTAELAIALPAVVVVLLLVLGVGAASTAQIRVVDAARAGARVAALGETDEAVVAVASRLGGPGSVVRVDRAPPWVTVHVERPVTGGWAGAVRVAASASAWAEP